MAGKQLTVLQILPALKSGGVERGTLEVARALVAAGHRSLVASQGGPLVETLVAAGSQHIALPVGRKSPLTLLQVRPLRRLLQSERIDILHVRSRLPAWIAWLAWRRMPPAQRPHFITTVHGLYSVNRYSAIMMRGECIIAVSGAAKQYIIDNYPGVDPHRIVTIYRGIDPVEFPYAYKPQPDWIREWYGSYPVLEGRKVLTLPGRLTRLKGHEDFIELVEVLVNQGLDVHGLIVGHLDTGRQAYIRELKGLIAEKGVEKRITFTGQRSNMRDIYAVSDVVLSLSRKPESFGRTVLEALSLGVPVVGYAHGGVGEILGTLYPSGRVPVGDKQRLASTVRAVLLSEAPTVEHGHNFSIEDMTTRTIEVYSQLASEG